MRRYLVAELVPVLIILVIPFSVHAGIFSFLGIATSSEVSTPIEKISYSATETPLLNTQAANPVATGGGDILIEDGALVAGGVGEGTAAPVARSAGEISVYTVRPGDALSQIAEMYGVTTNTILWANDLESAGSIQPGDALIILPIAGVRHEVKSGETIVSIVKKYEADLEEVLDYNNLAADAALAVGDELMIPGGSIVAPKTTPSRPSAAVAASGGASGLSHPVPGAIRTQGIHGYNGVDYAAAAGTSIRAAAAGEVIISKSSGWNGGYGQYVVIKHANGVQTLYAHLSANYVSVGDWVTAGESIGAMGNTGRSTGTHLHFEVRGGTNPF